MLKQPRLLILLIKYISLPNASVRESQLQSYDRNFSLMGLTAACVETVERRRNNNNSNNKSIKQLLLLLLLRRLRLLLLLLLLLLALRCSHSIVSALSRSSTIER